VRDLSASERRELLKSQTGKLKETLAAMSLIEAEEALEEGNTAGAINSFYEAIRHFPENPFYYIKLSEILQGEAKVTDAINTLKSSLQYCPNNPVIKKRLTELEAINPNTSKAPAQTINTENTVPLPSPNIIASKPKLAPPPPPPPDLPSQLSSSVKSNYAKLGLPGTSQPQSLEEVSTTSKDKTVPLPVKTLTKTQLERRERKRDLKSQTGRLKETLAEMSLIEAEECLERGDKTGAINSLKDAIKNYPENPTYYLKLTDLYIEENKQPEAIKLLSAALEYSPQNDELKNKLEKIQESLKPKNEIIAPQVTHSQKLKEIPAEVLADIDAHVERSKIPNQKQSSTIETQLERSKIPNQKQPTAKLNANKLLCPKCNIINDIEDLKCTYCNTPLSAANKIKPKPPETVVENSNRLKTKNIIILVVMAIVLAISFPLARRENAIVVDPIEPADKSTLDINKAEFQWDSVTENIGFLLTIEKDNQKIIERYTNNLVYTLSYDEIGLLKTNEVYSWQVIPVSPKRETLNYRTKKSEFKVINSTLSTNSQETSISTPSPTPTQSINQSESQKPSQGKSLDGQ
jgi:tetratricopeptide (TPR) repeat protein